MDKMSFHGESATLSEGQAVIKIEAFDLVSNKTTLVRNVSIDTISPTITIDGQDSLTKINSYQLKAKVADTGSVVTKVYNNDSELVSTNEKSVLVQVSLNQGANKLKVLSADSAGNTVSKEIIITLDNTPPLLSNISPLENSLQSSKIITISGKSDEELKSIRINETNFALSTNKKEFIGELTLDEGLQTLQFNTEDIAGNTSDTQYKIRVDSLSPTISVSTTGNITTQDPAFTISGEISDASEVTVKILQNDIEIYSSPEKIISYTATLNEGLNNFKIFAIDEAGHQSEVLLSNVNFDTSASNNIKPIAIFNHFPLSGEAPVEFTFSSKDSSDEDGVIKIREWDFGDGEQVSTDNATISHSFTTDGEFLVRLTVIDDKGGKSTIEQIVNISKTPEIPKDPKELAPQEIKGKSFAEANTFLYTGVDAIQKGVVENAIEKKALGILKGAVHKISGSPLSGVKISIKDHPEYGYTYTNNEGLFDFAVNGETTYTIKYQKPSYLDAQRKGTVSWTSFSHIPTVTLIQLDSKGTAINLKDSDKTQVATSSKTIDARGERNLNLIIPKNTTAEIILPNGTKVPLENSTVRMTEFTVGGRGGEAMPGTLPATSAYTYAAEFSIDEAEKLGADSVVFSKPLYTYLDNFLDIPVGGLVPVGYYNKKLGHWVGSEDGRVLEILSVDNGIASIDFEGDGTPTSSETLSAYGFTEDELKNIAKMYSPGKTLWRVGIKHFTSYDFNFNAILSDDGLLNPENLLMALNNFFRGSNTCSGSIIDIQNQSLGESVKVSGTELSLIYKSNRTPAYGLSQKIKLVPDNLPSKLLGVEVEVNVAGRKFKKGFSDAINPVTRLRLYDAPLSPGQEYNFTWDGRDAYGRTVDGPIKGYVKISYMYASYYLICVPKKFDGKPNGASTTNSWEIQTKAQCIAHGGVIRSKRSSGFRRKSKKFETVFANYKEQSEKLGLWTIDREHKAYPSLGKVVTGSGEIIEPKGKYASPFNADLNTLTILKNYPQLTTFDNKGNLLAFDIVDKIMSITPQGQPLTYIENLKNFDGRNYNVGQLSYGLDNKLYIYDKTFKILDQINKDGSKVEILGQHKAGLTTTDCYRYLKKHIKENSLLKSDKLPSCPIRDISVDKSGEVIFSIYDYQPTSTNGEETGAFIHLFKRKVNGEIHPLFVRDYYNRKYVGEYAELFEQNEYSSFLYQRAIPTIDGGVYLIGAASGFGNFYGYAYIDSEKNVKTFFNNKSTLDASQMEDAPNNHNDFMAPTPDMNGGENPALESAIVNSKGDLIFLSGSSGIFSLSQKEDTVTPIWRPNPALRTGPNIILERSTPLKSALIYDVSFIKLSPNGDLLARMTSNRFGTQQLIKIENTEGQFSANGENYIVNSSSGAEQYIFDKKGNHLKTIDPIFGITLYEFTRDENDQITSYKDKYGNATTFTVVDEKVQSIVGPYGHKTFLEYDSSNYLTSITNENNEVFKMLYHEDSPLLKLFEKPKGNKSQFTYDDKNRLISDVADSGLQTSLGFTFTNDKKFRFTKTSGEGRKTIFEIDNDFPAGVYERALVANNGTTTKTEVKSDFFRLRYNPDKSITSIGSTPSSLLGGEVLEPSMIATTVVPISHNFINMTKFSYLNEFEQVIDTDGDSISKLSKRTIEVDTNSRKSKIIFEPLSKIVTNTSAEGRTVKRILNNFGDIAETQIEGVSNTINEYDSKGRIFKVTQGPRETSFSYDEKGNLKTITNPVNKIVSFDYDKTGRVTKKIFPNNREISFSYDKNGNLESITPPSRPTHSFINNLFDLVGEYISPSLNQKDFISKYSYNKDQQLKNILLPDGSNINYNYHATKGRLVNVEHNSDTVSYLYDDTTGQLSQIQRQSEIMTHFTYEGPLIKEMGNSGAVQGAISFNYDTNFWVRSTKINASNHVLYDYDKDGLMTNAHEEILTYHPQNGLLQTSTIGNVSEIFAYTDFGEIDTVTIKNGAETIYISNFERNNQGMITDLIEDGVTQTFTYDDIGQLKTSTTPSSTNTYTWDDNGNRLSVDKNGTVITATFDDQDRMKTYGKYTFTYGKNGEVESQVNSETTKTTLYTYDAFSNLRDVTLEDGKRIDYVIDGQNRRVAKKVNGVYTEKFLYRDQLNPIAKLDADNNLIEQYVYASKSNVPDLIIRGAEIYRIISNHLGSPILVIKVSDGTIVQRIKYGEFGQVLSDTNSGFQPFGFAGGIYDTDTKLVRFGARDYNPQIGRWMSKDPIGFSGGDTNLYRYVGNDPVNFVDMNGTDRTEVLTKAGTHVGVLIYDPQMPGNNVLIDQGPREFSLGMFLNQEVPSVVDLNYSVPRNIGLRIPSTTIKQSRESDYRDIQRAMKLQKDAKSGAAKYQLLDFNFNFNDSSYNCRGFVNGI